jgi:predicted regulator of Ras-like GTPase activity (Roadblock/LC7/MglB family)
MAPKDEQILALLKEDLMQLEDIRACMVVRKNLEGITCFSDEFKAQILDIWEIMNASMNEFFSIIEKYSKYGLDKVYFELGKYDVIFFILPDTDTALVAIIPALANRGLLEVELENARRRIIKIIAAG